MKVKIYLNGNSGDFLNYIEKRNITKQKLLNEIFKNKIYCCQYSNKLIALNTEAIKFIEIED
jgi:hypothetical protein